MLGQKEICDQLTEMVEMDTLPRFLILTGLKGSGKYTLAKWLCKKMGAYFVEPDLSVDSVREVVRNCYKCSGETLYVFRDADKMSAAAKNALLKITEEPPRQAHFILTVQNAENTLETLRSRGTVIPMAPYSWSDREMHLLSFMRHKGLSNKISEDTQELIIKVSENLGQVERLVQMDVEKLRDFCQLVVDQIQTVSGVNALKIGQRLKLKEDGEGYEPDLFFQMMEWVLIEELINDARDNDQRLLLIHGGMMSACSRCAQELTLTGVKKDSTVDMWILEMREC